MDGIDVWEEGLNFYQDHQWNDFNNFDKLILMMIIRMGQLGRILMRLDKEKVQYKN